MEAGAVVSYAVSFEQESSMFTQSGSHDHLINNVLIYSVLLAERYKYRKHVYCTTVLDDAKKMKNSISED